MPVTLKDIAREVGLSVPTVSIALRKDFSARTSPETRERVREAAERLGYKHNMYARMLRTGKSKLIGVLIEDLSSEVHVAQLEAFNKLAGIKGYRTLIRFASSDISAQREIANELLSSRVEGIVMFASDLDSEFLQDAIEAKIPIVATALLPDVPADSVIVDRFLGSYIAVKHLLDLGHRKIATLHFPPTRGLAVRRMEGYLRALDEYGVAPDESLMVNMGDLAGDPAKAGWDAMQTLLARNLSPTAVFCHSDVTAFGAMSALQDAGLRIPEDVAVVGFDNVSFAKWSPIPLTTVAQPINELADVLADALFYRIEQPSDEEAPKRVMLSPRLIVRQSTVLDSRR